jgi:hypothetical protein
MDKYNLSIQQHDLGNGNLSRQKHDLGSSVEKERSGWILIQLNKDIPVKADRHSPSKFTKWTVTKMGSGQYP